MDNYLLQKHGWTVECKSPLELRHEDGSVATLNAAKLVIENLETQSLEQEPEASRRVSISLLDGDLSRIDALKHKLTDATRTSVIQRSIALLYWAFVTKNASSLTVIADGKQVGAMQFDTVPDRKTT